MKKKINNSFLLLVLVPAIFIGSRPCRAFFEFEKTPFSIDMGASLRGIFAGFQNYDDPFIFGNNNSADGMFQGIFRLTADGDMLEWLHYEVHGIQTVLSTTSGYSSLGMVQTGNKGMYRFIDTHFDWADSSDFFASMALDRFNIRFSLPWFDFTVGRQAINFSKTYFFSPLDVFLPFNPTSFDRDYKPGVDSVKIDIPIGDFSGITLVGALGRRLEIRANLQKIDIENGSFRNDVVFGSAFMARAFTTLGDFDLSVQGGKIYGGYEAGAGFEGEIFTLGIRGEASYFKASSKRKVQHLPMGASLYLVEDSVSAVLGIDRQFENSFYFALEYFYNSAGGGPGDLPVSMVRSMAGTLLAMGEHELGLVTTYEPYPLIKLQLAWIFSATDQSTLLSPMVSYSISDEADFLFSAYIGLGARPVNGELKSEYGSYPNVYLGEFKFYF
ncbi:MAG: hypothetical protein GXP49_04505 [Deltaproteobacteria bacterium]|nr:hypothetical protein [Deltaproteobacteria bacterium]